MDLSDRLGQLDDSLGEFAPTDTVAWQIGVIFNALLAQAKEQLPDDPVVSALESVEQNMTGTVVAGETAGSIRAAVRQILAVVPID